MNSFPNEGGTRNTAIYSLLQARESEGRPIRVGVIGAGATSRAIALQLGTPVAGMRLVEEVSTRSTCFVIMRK